MRHLHGQVEKPAVIDSQHPQAGELAYPRGELSERIARDIDLLERRTVSQRLGQEGEVVIRHVEHYQRRSEDDEEGGQNSEETRAKCRQEQMRNACGDCQRT